tara:strand:+ start:48501 stop:49337 length:837 start_codon:yes stop_codon:yes gene_type:complete
LNKLTELLEQDAPPSIQEIYRNIRLNCHTPMVALIYRHLATKPGVLEWAWASLSPIMRSGLLPNSAREMALVASYPKVSSLSLSEIKALDLLEIDVCAIRYIIAAYHAANPCNILATLFLLKLLRGSIQLITEPEDLTSALSLKTQQEFPSLPPMVDSELLPREILGFRPGSASSMGLTPSLYRHLGHWPMWLKVVSEKYLSVSYQSNEIDNYSKKLYLAAQKKVDFFFTQGEKIKFDDDRPLGSEKDLLCKTLDTFVETIPTLIIVGAILNQTLEEY